MPQILTKRYNADNSVSLISRGRVVFRDKTGFGCDGFCAGWFGTEDRKQWRFGKAQFRHSKKKSRS